VNRFRPAMAGRGKPLSKNSKCGGLLLDHALHGLESRTDNNFPPEADLLLA